MHFTTLQVQPCLTFFSKISQAAKQYHSTRRRLCRRLRFAACRPIAAYGLQVPSKEHARPYKLRILLDSFALAARASHGAQTHRRARRRRSAAGMLARAPAGRRRRLLPAQTPGCREHMPRLRVQGSPMLSILPVLCIDCSRPYVLKIDCMVIGVYFVAC